MSPYTPPLANSVNHFIRVLYFKDAPIQCWFVPYYIQATLTRAHAAKFKLYGNIDRLGVEHRTFTVRGNMSTCTPLPCRGFKRAALPIHLCQYAQNTACFNRSSPFPLLTPLLFNFRNVLSLKWKISVITDRHQNTSNFSDNEVFLPLARLSDSDLQAHFKHPSLWISPWAYTSNVPLRIHFTLQQTRDSKSMKLSAHHCTQRHRGLQGSTNHHFLHKPRNTQVAATCHLETSKHHCWPNRRRFACTNLKREQPSQGLKYSTSSLLNMSVQLKTFVI